ncbi:MAG: hypothetical protein RR177_02865 [Oscillospiraceae bacterium]
MKKDRQKVIIDLITNNIIDTQEDLQDRLNKIGFKVTQATVSRDVKELRIVKALDDYGVYRYISNKKSGNDTEIRFMQIFANSVISIEYAINDVVIKCHSGMASGACAALDNLYSDMVVGTLAGDDTILAITRSEDYASQLCEKLLSIIE